MQGADRRTVAWDHLVLSLIALVAIAAIGYPILFVVLRAISTDGVGSPLTFAWITEVFRSERSKEALLNTAIYTAGSASLAMLLGVGLAFLSARTDMPGRRFIGILAVLPILIPPFITVVGWVALADPSAGIINIIASAIAGPRTVLVNLNTMAGLVWMTGLFLTPYVFLMVSAGFTNADAAMEEAARVSGAGRWRLFTTVILPMQKPALLAALLLVIVMSAGDFIIPSTVGLKARIYMLPSLIWQNTAALPGRPGLAASQSLLLVVLGLVCIYFQRRALARGGRYTSVGGKGAGLTLFSLGAARYPVAFAAYFLALCSTALPVLSVTGMAFMRYWAPYAMTLENVTLHNFQYMLFEYPQVGTAMRNSLFLAILGASLCVALAVALSWYVTRMRGVLSGVVQYAMVIPLGVPGIALGLGILSFWIALPVSLYGTVWILLLAYVTAHIPVAMQFVGSALHRIQVDLEEASRISGRGLLGTILHVNLPLMRPALIGCWLLMYVVILREISLIILLYTPRTVVLSVGLMDVWGSGFYPELAVYSLLLMVLGLIPVVLLFRYAQLNPRT